MQITQNYCFKFERRKIEKWSGMMRLVYRYVIAACAILALVVLIVYRQYNGRRSPSSEVIRLRNWGPGAVFYNPFGNKSALASLSDSRMHPPNPQEAGDQWMVDLRKKHNINIYLSDSIPINRAIPDSRPPGCKTLTFPAKLPTLSVVIAYHNEWPSLLLRTVYSIVNRTPKSVLKEIILVDDASGSDVYQMEVYKHIRQIFDEKLVQMVTLPIRSGLIRARLEGFKHVTGQTVAFFDSHMEVNVDWAQPLLQQIMADDRTIAMAQLDYVERNSLKYTFTKGYRTRYGFDWRLQFFETEFRQDQLTGKSDMDVLPGVVMVGAAFVVDVKFFSEIGTYDDGMKIWGGENLELSWRVWLCGGRLVHVPCSRVGHIERAQPYDFLADRRKVELYNYKRAISVWMDEYSRYVYGFYPEMKSFSMGDVDERFMLKRKLRCRPFDWFLTNIWPELFTYDVNVTASGGVGLENYKPPRCLDNNMYLFSAPAPLHVSYCNYHLMQQNFALTTTKQLRTILQCVYVKMDGMDHIPRLANCLDIKDQWEHSKEGHLVHLKTRLCISLLRNTLIMRECTTGDPSQTWTFASQRKDGRHAADW
ncbi:inactive polypeptide N-acetylgalactosaminyltransferase-like protein 5 [Pecten maximus]|uniref:inactive polypeptide N-acetylgalactosaminyltransferase-like protein 5 n=1 Tax=Pecten maximus TaxID=6579 RepID=UPI0014589016|nr:inactive polypeptide N-acetylgalactosaminyltransferase-like protein 5 [Pecten maximus]